MISIVTEERGVGRGSGEALLLARGGVVVFSVVPRVGGAYAEVRGGFMEVIFSIFHGAERDQV